MFFQPESQSQINMNQEIQRRISNYQAQLSGNFTTKFNDISQKGDMAIEQLNAQ